MPDLLPKSETWKYAIMGGFFSIPLSLGNYWLSGMGSEFSTGMVFFGGLLAGYLAKKNSANVARAGVGAGVVGGLPGYIWILPRMVQTGTDFATAWSSPVAAAVLMGVFSVIIIGIAALPGYLGGITGGWLVEKIARKRTPVSST